MLYVNGLQLEEPTTKLAEAAGGAEIVELGTKAIPEREYAYDFSFPRSGGKPNPHLWTDPTYALKFATIVRDDLIKRVPSAAAAFRRNDEAFANLSATSTARCARRSRRSRAPGAGA